MLKYEPLPVAIMNVPASQRLNEALDVEQKISALAERLQVTLLVHLVKGQIDKHGRLD